MKYRDHTGSLTESMKTVQEIATIEALKTYLDTRNNKKVETIMFQHAGFDKRINWDTYNVLQKLTGETDFTVAGMSDEELT
jgi:hypothetical protein